MRVVWKDSKPKVYKPIKYRKYMICGSPCGWTTNFPGDDFLYKNHYSAQNAIDRALGDEGQRGSEKRKSYGIQIVGKKSKELNQ